MVPTSSGIASRQTELHNLPLVTRDTHVQHISELSLIYW